MEGLHSDTPPSAEYWRGRLGRAQHYLEQNVSAIVNYQFGQGEGPDYGEVVSRYFFSVAAVAQETEQLVNTRSITEISRAALEQVPAAQRERASHTQDRLVRQWPAVRRITFSFLHSAKQQTSEVGDTKERNIPDAIIENQVSYLELLDAIVEGRIFYDRSKKS